MEFNIRLEKNLYEIILIISFLVICCLLTYYFHFILKTGVIFTHFFYVPIVLATVWWKYRGLVIPASLALILILSHYVAGGGNVSLNEDYIRAFMFMFIGTVVAYLSERVTKTEETLSESEEKFKEVFNQVNDIITLIELKEDGGAGNYIEVNDVAIKILGYSFDEFLQMKPSDIGKKGEYTRDKVNTLLNKGRVTFERTYITKDGLEIPVEINSHVFTFKGKKVALSVARDISERKKAEEINKRLAAIVESSDDAIIFKDLNGIIKSWNRGAEKIYGYSADEIIGKSISLLISSDSDELSVILKNIKKGKGIEHYETTRIKKNGEKIYISLTISPVRDINGNLIGASSIGYDMTERKKAEEAFKEMSYRNQLILNSVGEGIYGIDREGNITFFNNYAESITGYIAEEVIGKNAHDLIHHTKIDGSPFSVDECAVHNMSLMLGKSERILNDLFWKKDGTSFPVDYTTTPLIENGQINGAVVVFIDITKRKKAEDALKQSEEKFRELFNSANDMISLNYIEKDGLPGKFIEINDVGCKRLGYTKDEFLNMTPKDIIAPEKFLEMPKNALELKKSGYAEYEMIHVTKNGGKIPVEVNNHIFNFKGKTVALAISRDITERKEAEKLLKESLREKEMLLKEIHHRVKNNLMVISSLLNLQSQYIKDKEVLGIFKESQSRAKSMAMIHERLYRSSDLKRIDFGEYIKTLATDLFRTYVHDSSLIKLNMDVEDIMLDINTAVPLGLIVNELVSNSMKHAFPDKMEGKIEVDFKHKGSNFLLSVSDNGVGLPEDVDFKNTESLGLQLVNSLVNQIDGEINLNKEKGTEFTIIFREYKSK